MTRKRSRPARSQRPLIQLACACASVRRAERLLSQIYDEELRDVGLRVNQFTLLQALAIAPGMSQKQLAELLDIDSTTLTRTLAALIEARLVRAEEGEDRRLLRLSLTSAGERKLAAALPRWESAQSKLRRALGDKGWKNTQAALLNLTAAARSLR